MNTGSIADHCQHNSRSPCAHVQGEGGEGSSVDDLEQHVSDLNRADFPMSAITTGEMARFATVSDPEGNTVTFAEPLGSS